MLQTVAVPRPSRARQGHCSAATTTSTTTVCVSDETLNISEMNVDNSNLLMASPAAARYVYTSAHTEHILNIVINHCG